MTREPAQMENTKNKPISDKDYFNSMKDQLHLSPEEQKILENLTKEEFPQLDKWILDQSEHPKLGSITQLLLYITSSQKPSVQFVKIFFSTYFPIASKELVLGAIIVRFFENVFNPDLTEKELKENRIWAVHLIVQWLKLDKISFAGNMGQIVSELSDLLEESSMNRKVIKETLSDSNVFISTYVPPPPLINSFESIDKIPPLEFARQITYSDSELFYKVNSNELLSIIYDKNFSGNIDKLISLSNKLSNYITFNVLSATTVEARSSNILMWLEVANILYNMHNFHGLFTVMCGLNHQSVLRLNETMRQTFKKKKDKKALYDQLTNIVDIASDFANYRKVLRQNVEPCIPFLGCLRRDLIYVQEGEKNFIDGLVNIRKLEKCFEIINEFNRFQNQKFIYVPVQAVQEFLHTLPNELDLIILMKISKSIEKTNPKK